MTGRPISKQTSSFSFKKVSLPSAFCCGVMPSTVSSSSYSTASVGRSTSVMYSVSVYEVRTYRTLSPLSSSSYTISEERVSGKRIAMSRSMSVCLLVSAEFTVTRSEVSSENRHESD